MYRSSNRHSNPGSFSRGSWGWSGPADELTPRERNERLLRLFHRLSVKEGDHCRHVFDWIDVVLIGELPF